MKKGKLYCRTVRTGRTIESEVTEDQQFMLVPRKSWTVEYVDEFGATRRVKGYSDKQLTERYAVDLERGVERIRAGEPLARPDGIANLKRPIANLVEEYLGDLERRGRGERHRNDIRKLFALLQNECGWNTLADVTQESFRAFLSQMHQKGRSARTQNRYHQAAGAFLKFCVNNEWLRESPIKSVQKATEGQAARVRIRRAFRVDELRRLFAQATERRRLIYRVAAFSGFRKGELGLLQKRDCDPIQRLWTPRAQITKARRCEVLPMSAECAEALREHWQSLGSETSPLFPPDSRRMGQVQLEVVGTNTFKKDLQAASIPRQDEQLRWLDFHSFRLTFCELLAKQLPIQQVSLLMRHHDFNLTVKTYQALGLQDSGDCWTLPFLLPSKDLIDASHYPREDSNL